MDSLRRRLEKRHSKKLKQDKKSVVAKVFNEYCSNTSIHGIGYLGAEDKSMAEKVWWLIVFLLSLIVCIVLIFRTWAKWNENPVIISYSQEPTPIWQIPFPAVTICPMNKIKQATFNYTAARKSYESLSPGEKKQFLDMSLICGTYMMILDEANNDRTNTTDDDVIDSIMQHAPAIYENIIGFLWKGTGYAPTKEYLTPIMTEEGLCFTFNGLNTPDMFTDEVYMHENLRSSYYKNPNWTLEDGYPEDSPLNTYPRRAAREGIHAGVSILLMSQISQREFGCGIPIAGFKIMLHNPAEIPKVKQHYILAPAKRHINAAVTPSVTTTSKGLTNIDPKIRKCFFSNEKSLRFYRTYTQDNCRTECLVNMTVSYCGCVPFLLPRDNNTKICSHRSNKCMESIESDMIIYEMAKNKKKELDSPLFEHYESCNCLPSCHSLMYSAETSQAKLYFKESLEVLLNDKFDSDFELTQVEIFFKESHFLSLRRSELFGQTDFLANCGGLLGLFMGFSILSLIEIIYFSTIRFWFSIKHRNKMVEVNKHKIID